MKWALQIILLICVGFILLLHSLDGWGTPIITNYLDWLVMWTYRTFPFLRKIDVQDPSWIACIEASVVLFFLLEIFFVMIPKETTSNRLAGKLGKGNRGKDEDDFAR